MKRAWHFVFGKKLKPEEILRRNKRALTRSIRQLDRERSRMEAQEKKLIMDIKKMAKDGQMEAVKIMAKDLVRTRHYIKKFMIMKANLQAVEMKLNTIDSQAKMAQAMKGVTMAMRAMNAQLQLPQIKFILREFERQAMIMDMKNEFVEDTIDHATVQDSDEEECDTIVAEICDELGLQLNNQLSELPQTQGNLRKAEKVPSIAKSSEHSDLDDQILARLQNLRLRGDSPDSKSP